MIVLMFDEREAELSASTIPTGVRLARALTHLAEVTSVLSSFRFAELSEPVVKEALVALDGCRNRLDRRWCTRLGVFDAQAMWAGDGGAFHGGLGGVAHRSRQGRSVS